MARSDCSAVGIGKGRVDLWMVVPDAGRACHSPPPLIVVSFDISRLLFVSLQVAHSSLPTLYSQLSLLCFCHVSFNMLYIEMDAN